MPKINSIAIAPNPNISKTSEDPSAAVKLDTSHIAQQRIQTLLHSFSTNTDLAEQRELMQQAQSLYVEFTTESDKEFILEKLSRVPANERAAIVRHMKCFVEGSGVVTLMIMKALDTLISLPASERDSCLRHAKTLFQEPVKESGYNIFKALSKIPAHERENCIQQAKSLYTHSMKESDKASILHKLVRVPANERVNLIHQMKCFVDDASALPILWALNTLVSLPASERDSCLRQAKALFKEPLKACERYDIFNEISKIPSHERESCIQQASLFFTDSMPTKDKCHIIHQLGKASANERTSLVQYTKTLVDAIGPSVAPQDILKSLLDIPQNNWGSLVQDAQKLFAHTRDAEDKFDILECLTIMSRDEREHVVPITVSLITEAKIPLLVKEFLTKIRKIDKDQREDVVRLAKSLFTDSMHEGLKYAILESVSNTPVNERESAIQYIKTFFANEMRSDIKANIIHAMSWMDADRRKNLMEYTRLLYKESMGEPTKADIFLCLYGIPSYDLDAFVKHARPLFTNSVQPLEASALLDCLSKLVLMRDSWRPGFVQDVQNLMPDSLSHPTRATLIRLLGSIPRRDLRAGAIQEYFSSDVDPSFLQAIAENQEAQVQEPIPKEPMLDEILATNISATLPAGLHPQHQEILIKALKIKQYYNKLGYVCFLHGQEPSRLVLQLLLKEVEKMRGPEQHFKDPFVYFRSGKFYEDTKGHKEQMSEELKKMIYHDNDQRDQVMSVDAYFLSTAPHESANYFCKETRSVSPLETRGAADLDPLVGDISPGAGFAIQHQINALMAIVSQNMPCGNLCVCE